MFGGEVNKTKVGEGAPAAQQNVCPIVPTDICGAGVPGTGQGYFSNAEGNYIAYSPATNAILVGDVGRIEEFNLDGSFKSEIAFEGALGAFSGKTVNSLDVDSEGNIYFDLRNTDDVYKLDAAGVPVDPGKPGGSAFKAVEPGAISVDGEGHVYTIEDPLGSLPEQQARVLEFDAEGVQLLPTAEEEEVGELFPYLPANGPELPGLATNICSGSEPPGNLFLVANSPRGVGYVEVYGTAPVGCEPPPPNPPIITAQFASPVGASTASVRAEINPRFFADTTYYVEYGEGKCSEGGCDQRQPLSAATLTSKVVNKAVRTAAVTLPGLKAGTTYHFRFVAQSGGGGPVFGVDPDGDGPEEASEEEGAEGTFTTFRPATAPAPCPANEGFRSGPGAKLSDCRAYEMVSPLDKENGDAALLPTTYVFFEVNQSAPSGDRFTYSSMTPFAGPESAPFVSQFLADRQAGVGWSNRDISVPHSARVLELNRSVNNDFKAFSSDLCMALLRSNSAATLTADAVPGYPNLYRRDNCSEPVGYEALTTATPPTRPAAKYDSDVLGFSGNGAEAIFLATDKLTEDAPALKEIEQKELLLYEHGPNGLHFVCYLPSGTPNNTACGPGITAGQPDGHASEVRNAISADGSRVFWTAYSGELGVTPEGKSGKIYVRLNPDQAQSPVEGGHCSEPELACTIAISTTISPEPAQYWGASDNGSKVIFKFTGGPKKDVLYEFDVDGRTSRPIAEGVEGGQLGMSEDASHVYFDSTEVLGDGASEGAEAGAHNLYLYVAPEEEGEEGSFDFIMKLAGSDLQGAELRPSAINAVPTQRSSVVSPNGAHAAFTSSVSPTPTGYDNLDAEGDEADEEAYLYDAGSEKLRCVSCNPTGARPLGQNLGGVSSALWVAARLPNPRTPLHAPHTLADDGRRLFFESHEALLPRDTNKTWDVYQWEAPGTGSCAGGDATFSQTTGGCVDLISSGESPAQSHFLDADPSGANVFIATQSSLVAADYGLSDVYDARIGGGLPEPPSAPGECEGESCQSPPPPPASPTPASSAFEGEGNVKPSKRKRRCAKGRRNVRHHGKVHRGKVHCVRKRGHGAKRKAGR